MDKLLQYIKSTFNKKVDIDAKQYSPVVTLNLLSKHKYYVYISPITFSHIKNKQQEYISFVKKAAEEWSNSIDNKIIFEITDKFTIADVKVYWVKATKKALGIQYTENISNYKKLAISIGITDKDYIPFDSNFVYQTVLHEFGHIMGLGHSPNKTDIMNPIINEIYEISDNDKFVLNLIYKIGTYKTHQESKNYIENHISKYLNITNNSINSNINLLNNLSDIANINKSLFYLQNL